MLLAESVIIYARDSANEDRSLEVATLAAPCCRRMYSDDHGFRFGLRQWRLSRNTLSVAKGNQVPTLSWQNMQNILAVAIVEILQLRVGRNNMGARGGSCRATDTF